MKFYDILERIRNCIQFLVLCNGLKLLRAACWSLVLFPLLIVLRKTVARRSLFARFALWGLLLPLPFMGNFKFYYETMTGIRMFFRWHYLVGTHRWTAYVVVGGVLASLLRMLWKHISLKRAISAFAPAVRGDRQLAVTIERFGRMTEIPVYVTDLVVSPFAVGLFRPRIIIPADFLVTLEEVELNIILKHEATHIRLGHLVWLFLFDIYRCLFWFLPFFHLAAPRFKADIEQICDAVCMKKQAFAPFTYGSVLLKCSDLLTGKPKLLGSYANFVETASFRHTKRRIVSIANYAPYRTLTPKLICWSFLVTVFLAFAAVKALSYPIYIDYQDLALCNENGTAFVLNSKLILSHAITVEENVVRVDQKLLKRILEYNHIKGDSFFIYFGGFGKMPGFGGGGNGVFLDLTETDEVLVIPYEDNQDIFTILLKWL